MSTLIPNRQLSGIRQMTPEQLRLMRACEVYDGDVSHDENYLYTHTPRNPYDGIVADSVRTRAETAAFSSNSIYPLEVVQQEAQVVDRYPNLTKARKARRLKQEAKVTA